VNVLVTGSSGRVGRHVVPALEGGGHDVVAFDLVCGNDVRDPEAVRAAARGVDAIVHLAVAAHNGGVDPATLMATNVTGTVNALEAAVANGVPRFVHASSVNALGVFLGLRAPDYLPIDDDHPCYATSPYGISKYLGEEFCARASRTTGMSTICLRMPRVVDPHEYAAVAAEHLEHCAWEYGAFLDARDAATVVHRAVNVVFEGHARVLVTGPDAMGVTPPVLLADRLLPDVPWKDRASFEADRSRPLVRTERAQALLGWTPVHSWAANVAGTPVRGRVLRRRMLRVLTGWRRSG
jgi:UDP-glucose 4-epimerase